MRIAPDSISGKRLRRHGVSSKALKKARLYTSGWQPVPALTVPFPFSGCIILIRQELLDRDADGELSDSPALAPLVHQFCHVNQRQEWGFFLYLLRHLRSRVFERNVAMRHRQAERECCEAARRVQEYYLPPEHKEV